MNFKILTSLAPILACAAVPGASAQVLIGGASLSGAYAVTATEICQATSGKNSGQVTMQSVTMTFTAATTAGAGNVTIKGSSVTALGLTVPPIVGANFRTVTVSKTAKFSLAEGALTIGGKKYNVQLASVTNHGLLAKSFTFSGVDGDCGITGMGIQ